MTTIERILGNNPSESEVRAEFNRRGLSLKGFNETIVESDGQHHVHGNYSTRSAAAEIASQKMLIIYDELNA